MLFILIRKNPEFGWVVQSCLAAEKSINEHPTNLTIRHCYFLNHFFFREFITIGLGLHVREKHMNLDSPLRIENIFVKCRVNTDNSDPVGISQKALNICIKSIEKFDGKMFGAIQMHSFIQGVLLQILDRGKEFQCKVFIERVLDEL